MSHKVVTLQIVNPRREFVPDTTTEWKQLPRAVTLGKLEKLIDVYKQLMETSLRVIKPSIDPSVPGVTCFYPVATTRKKGSLRKPRPDGYVLINYEQPSGAANRAKKKGVSQEGKGEVLGAYAHHISWFCYNNCNESLLYPQPQERWHIWHISHLCHDPRCCNPAHLVREPAWVNHRRKECDIAQCVCQQDGGFSRCLAFPPNSYSPLPEPELKSEPEDREAELSDD
jgi:hypothetical protein